ncbi:shikimate kinase [Streptomyces sp. GMY02]|uniref:shikimate kinase n=1 Tax=Streptomyces sp. GMY02 TaxID=1333528 RepID=UPI001C2CBEB4|nr:shikimate kinase [Streptomyces sp. GMY02]QXE37855.1 shikimate kinase [Streptomyces sp. GMY02]
MSAADPAGGPGGPVVVLIGPMGVGKTTVGELLAERLGTGFRDSDADIVAAEGRPISDIFIEEGEDHFRTLEREAVRAAVAGHPGVLALGGGAVLDASTRELLKGLPVVFLSVEVAEAVKRVGLNTARPLLAVNPRKQWKELMEARRHHYTDVARAVVATDDRTPEEVADAVLDALGLKRRSEDGSAEPAGSAGSPAPAETPTPGKETHV